MRTPGWLVASMIATAAAPLLSAGKPPGPLPVCLHLINQASLSFRTVNAMRSELSEIWSRSAQSIVWHRAGVDCYSARARLSVVIMPNTERPLPEGVLATIEFAGGLPLNEIRGYSDRTDALLAREFRRNGPPFFVPTRDELMGRVLGRSVAHEVGHYLLRSPRHARQGLMQERHSARDLIRRSLRPFLLDPLSADVLLRWPS